MKILTSEQMKNIDRRTTERFDALRNSKSAPDRHRRSGSPPAGSTFTTSAPASASSLVQ